MVWGSRRTASETTRRIIAREIPMGVVSRGNGQRCWEAGGVARLLDVSLRRVGCAGDDVGGIVDTLGRLARTALQDAHGHVEPRSRFRRSKSTPVVRQRPRSLLFVDESGHSGRAANSGQRVFA